MTVMVPVRGHYDDILGMPATGHVKFTARPAAVYDAATMRFIIGQSRTAVIDGLGDFEVEVHATDDPDLSTVGWTYEVKEWIGSEWLRPSFDIEVPSALAGAGLELGDVAPVAPWDGTATAFPTLTAFTAEVAARTDADTTEATDRAAGDATNAAAVTAEAATRAAAVTAEAAARTAADALLIPATLVGAANGVASLDASAKVPVAQLPATVINDTFVVASQAAMLALTAQRGDVAIRSDVSKTFILATDSPATLADWKELPGAYDPAGSAASAQAAAIAAAAAADALLAPIASPTFTGIPRVPAVLPYVRTPQAASARQVLDSLPEPRYPDRLIVPPAALFAASGAGVWYAQNAATFMRFGLPSTRTYRYVNLYVGVQSGNIQVGVVRLRTITGQDAASLVASSGVIACPAAGIQRIDLGHFTLPPGDYALFLWCDNTTAQFTHGLVSGITASRTTFSQTYAGGVPALPTFLTLSVTTRWVSGLTLEAGVLPVVLLGDSIVANDGVEATDWWSDADELTGYRFYPATNAGVAGNTTAQILARTAAAAVGMRYAVVLGGTNDVGGAVSAATTIANLTAIYDLIAAAGATFLACTIPPRTGLSAGQATNLRDVNAWIRANYANWAGARLCDWTWALSDGTDETVPLAGNFSDGVHPNTTGCAIMSALLIKSIRDWI